MQQGFRYLMFLKKVLNEGIKQFTEEMFCRIRFFIDWSKIAGKIFLDSISAVTRFISAFEIAGASSFRFLIVSVFTADGGKSILL